MDNAYPRGNALDDRRKDAAMRPIHQIDAHIIGEDVVLGYTIGKCGSAVYFHAIPGVEGNYIGWANRVRRGASAHINAMTAIAGWAGTLPISSNAVPFDNIGAGVGAHEGDTPLSIPGDEIGLSRCIASNSVEISAVVDHNPVASVGNGG